MTSMIEHACGEVLDELNDRGLLKDVDDDLFDEIGKAVARRVIEAVQAELLAREKIGPFCPFEILNEALKEQP